MALPRKGSRRIVVDGVVYRRRLRGRPTYDQGSGMSPCTYAVEDGERPGTTLVVTTNQVHPSNWVGGVAVPVRPADVADSIRAALARGWTPTKHGSPFLLDRSEGFVSAL
ncbi:hypothetical protein [Streptoalloteichus hindustanus]|uniref:Uncharacterized protein n=1 Tax=Streptoalloteichus hindustanus TaxID=2017 RepID=A0A1M4UMU5_STRHI|nr:hypothetical protein [Streptoalloteichus hindustanus]SHE58004.1 hypothetical protein SAMN05444320_101485 [Streptoalloteichus hindustanus]